MALSSSRAVFVLVLLINCLLWSQSHYANIPSLDSSVSVHHPSFRRSLASAYESQTSDWTSLASEGAQCEPLKVPVDKQCLHVSEACSASPTFLSIPYLESYFCSSPTSRPLAFAGLLLWLIFLFSTLGISASDFFCPNLATLASLLGLDENVAGVTFLAFGNGSPDVFSTFSAMRANSGSLAIGELLGAASFITSCVVGAMCIIKPFRVNRGPFLRDIGFFTVAVTLFLVMLWDGTIQAWEAGGLVVVYAFYVLAVVIGSWLSKRKERVMQRDALIRSEYAEDGVSQEPYFDEEPRDDLSPTMSLSTSTLLSPDTRPASRTHSHQGPPHLEIQTGTPRRPSATRLASHTSEITPMPSFSLVGALEFRDVVTSLQSQAASSSLSVFDSPITPYPGGHYHQHLRRPRSLSRSPLISGEENPFDRSMGLPLNDRSPVLRHSAPPESLPVAPLIDISNGDSPNIPIISHTPASPSSDTDSEVQHQSRPLSRRRRALQILSHAYHILFPTITHFRAKPWLGKIAGIFAAPAVLALTITLPVVVIPYNGAHVHEKAVAADTGLNAFEEEGIERTLIAEEEVQEDIHELHYNKWLMAAQCILGPLFCTAVLTKGMSEAKWIFLAASCAGLVAGALVLSFSDNGDHPAARLARCSMGFLLAMVWIMAIADEVVKVLQTFGFIFGLSDAIIGLTIFAVGNSLADLVANMSVAVFAPIMGFSACFGGPMLNMLLGVGISGSYIIHSTSQPYKLNFSTTLIVSAIGLLSILLATMIFVPWNGYYIPRMWGFFLIGLYVVIMVVNIVVEVLDI